MNLIHKIAVSAVFWVHYSKKKRIWVNQTGKKLKKL
jgi:hypothetical protein